MQVELGEKGKYIVAAARQISLAQQCEANGNYHMAFTYYKNCVGVLLTGVQGRHNFFEQIPTFIWSRLI